MRVPALLDSASRDFHYALRSLRKDPRFAFVAIFALALSIGASTVIFSIFYNLTFDAIAAKDPDRLVVPVLQDAEQGDGFSDLYVRWADLQYLQNHNHVFARIEGYRTARAILRDGSRTFQFDGALVTPDAFVMYGVPPFLGRSIAPGDGAPGADPVFMMSYGTWKGEFAADPAIIGKKFVIDGQSRTLIGVTAARFHGFDVFKEIFTPVSVVPANQDAAQKIKFHILARLKSDATIAAASSEFDLLAEQLAVSHKDDDDFPKKFTGRVVPASEYLTGISAAGQVFNSKIDLKSILMDLLVAVLVLLLIACSNVANLLLARATVREKEIAVRTALGASRAQILRQLLLESFVLASAACGAGCLLAYAAMKFVNTAIHQKNWTQIGGEAVIGLNIRVLLFVVGITFLTTLLCGLLPAFRVSRRDLQPQIVGAGASLGGGVRHSKLRAGLVVGQVALSMVLLVGAGLMMRSLYKLTHIDLGFDPKNILVIALAPSRTVDQLPDRQLMSSPEGQARFDRVVEKIRRMPGVESVAVNNTIPASGPSRGPQVSLPSGAHAENAGLDECDDYCPATLGLRLLAGRWLTHDEVATRQFVAVLNQRLAHDLFGTANPIGQQLAVADFAPWKNKLERSFRLKQEPESPNATFTVVGVVQDVKNAGPQQPAFPMAFIPPMITGSFILQVRTKVPPRFIMHALQEQVWNSDPAQVFWIFDPLSELLEQHTYMTPEFGVALSGPLAGIALLLVVIGIFSVMAYTVSLQTREIGIRMAVGAQKRQILGMVLRRGGTLIIAGIAIGTLASFALTRILASQIWGISATDPATFAFVVVLIFAAGSAAGYLPARAATGVDPLVALRYE